MYFPPTRTSESDCKPECAYNDSITNKVEAFTLRLLLLIFGRMNVHLGIIVVTPFV